MILLLALSAAAVLPTATVPDRRSPTARCPIVKMREAQATTPLPRAHPLNEEPTAHQEIAVLVKDDRGCTRPIVVREDVGG